MPTTENKKKRKLPNLVTIWRKDGDNFDDYGNPSYMPPVYIWCRYEESSRLYRTTDGREVRSRANVYADVPVGTYGDYVARGQYTTTTPISEALEVQDVRSSSTLSGSTTQYRVIV